MRSIDVLIETSTMANLQRPDLIRSTKLIKHIGTIAQVLNLQNHELDILANFMGHEIRVHRNFYRLPENTLKLAKVSKILVAMEQGNISKYRGKTLDETEIDIDDNVEDGLGNDIEKQEQSTALNKKNESENNTQLDVGEKVHDTQNSYVKNKKYTGLPSKKLKKSPIKKAQKTSIKKHWSKEEKDTVLKYFENEINLKIAPKKTKCEKCIAENNVLRNRSWKHIKYWVYNVISRRPSLI